MFFKNKEKNLAADELSDIYSKLCNSQKIDVEISQEQIRQILRKSVTMASRKEVQREGTRYVKVLKDNTGKSIHIKNILTLDLKRFLELLIAVSNVAADRNIASLLMLCKTFMDMIEIPLTSDEIYILLIISKNLQLGKKVNETNILSIFVENELPNTREYKKEEVHIIINRLLKLGLLNCSNGEYTIVQKILV